MEIITNHQAAKGNTNINLMMPFVKTIMSYHLNFFYEALLIKLPRGMKFNFIFQKKRRICFYITYLIIIEGKQM